MTGIFHHLIVRPRTCLAIGALLTLALGLGVVRLQIDNSTSGLFLDDDPDVGYWGDVRANFGPDPDLFVIVRSGDLFGGGALGAARELAAAVAAVPGVRRAVSLFNVRTMREETFEVGGRSYQRVAPGTVLARLPATVAESKRVRMEILGDSVLRDTLVNGAGNAMVVGLEIDVSPGGGSTEEAVVAAVVATTKALTTTLEAAGLEVEVYGRAFVKAAITESIWENLALLGPVALVVVLGIILAAFRSVVAMALPLLTGVTSVLATLGLMGYLGIAMTPISSTVVVLVLVIGCVEDIHLVAGYARGIRAGRERIEAVRALGETTIPASVLAVLTTVLGFLAIVPSPVPQLREFAVACAAGVLINFVLTLLFVPALLGLLPIPRAFRRTSSVGGRVTEGCGRILRARGWVLGGFAVSAAVAGLGVARLETDTDYLRFFPADSPVNEIAERVSNDFGGSAVFSVAVETERADGIYEWETFRALNAFSGRLEERFGHALSVGDLLRELPRDPPTSQADLDELIALLPRSLLSPFVDHDGSRALIRVRSSSSGSKGMRLDAEAVKALADEVLPAGIEVRISGELPLLHRFADEVVGGLVQGLALLLAAVGLVFGLAFRSWRCGAIGVVVNFFPSVVTLGLMGWMGIPLGVGTFAIAIVALGISADDTLHFLVRQRAERRRGGPPNGAVAVAFATELQPVLVTTVAVTVGFLVLGLSSLALHREAAVLYAVAFGSALVADLLLLPCLLAGRDQSRNLS